VPRCATGAEFVAEDAGADTSVCGAGFPLPELGLVLEVEDPLEELPDELPEELPVDDRCEE
jgi:hypothetical protein